MAGTEEHLAALLGLPENERARVARLLLDSLYGPDEVGDDVPEQVLAQQEAEVARRLETLDAGDVETIDGEEARQRILDRLHSIRRP